jgi:glycosyltransferase involved in cell wall biosynthesis
MIPDETRPRSRRKVLFLSFVYPSFAGSGNQLRSAALLRMLATQADIYLLIAGYVEKLGGPKDQALEGLCRKITYLRILPGAETGGAWPPPRTKAAGVALPVIDCAQEEAPERIVQFYRENELECLFVFRFEALHFVYRRLASFPIRHLDLDELPSRRQAVEIRLKGNPSAPLQKTAQAAAHLMEKKLLHRFQRVFVSSSVEADQVRRMTGFQRPLILPNVYPTLLASRKGQAEPRNEILFVGNLTYPPNTDAVLYFCREILPRIREIKGDGVSFRVIGMGRVEALEGVRSQPGVELIGYRENLAPFYASAAVVVVPLRGGAGTRFKIIESFAHGRAVVSTSAGAEGLEVTDGKDILIADDPDAFAHACIRMMDDPERAQQICKEATRLHRDLYSEDALLRCYANITSHQEDCDE